MYNDLTLVIITPVFTYKIFDNFTIEKLIILKRVLQLSV